MKPVGEPCEGKPHARFDEGGLETCMIARNGLRERKMSLVLWCASPLLYSEAVLTFCFSP
jgi:hypothetical protein